jgi:hypothetical protein
MLEPPRPWPLRQAALDAAGYDRMHVLATELLRIRNEGGAMRIQIGQRPIGGRGSTLLVT